MNTSRFLRDAMMARTRVGVGGRVLARWDGRRFWYPGTVDAIDGDRVSIRYDDGMFDTRPSSQVKPFDWTIGSRIDAQWSGDGQWYGATITEMSRDGTELSVHFEDGIHEKKASAYCRSQLARSYDGDRGLN